MNTDTQKLEDYLPPKKPKEESCPLHKIPLRAGYVNLKFGLRSKLFYEQLKIINENLPYNNSIAGGGCRIYKGMKIKTEVQYCPKCRSLKNRIKIFLLLYLDFNTFK